MKFEFPNIFSFFQTKKDPESTLESKITNVTTRLQELTLSTNPDLSTASHQITRRGNSFLFPFTIILCIYFVRIFFEKRIFNWF